MTNIEALAKHLHEAGRAAVLSNKVIKKDGAPLGQIKFLEWDEISEEAREGRRIQAQWLLSHYYILSKTDDMPGLKPNVWYHVHISGEDGGIEWDYQFTS